jgi:DNA polymerase III alpha subunit
MSRVIHGDIKRYVDAQGQVWFSGSDAAELLLRGFDLKKLHIELTSDVEQYNAWCVKKDKGDHIISDIVESSHDRLKTWKLADFAELDVRKTILSLCNTDIERQRAELEMDLFEARDMMPVLRLMFRLVDHFRRNKIVWGVGRGSSVNSFVLYKIGIHKINPLMHGLDISDFLRN